MNNSTLQKIPSAADLFSRLQNITNDYLAVCIDYAKSVALRPEIKDELIELGCSRILVNRMERIGTGAADPRLLTRSGRAFRKLEMYPLSEQKEALEKGVIVWDASTEDTRIVQLDELSAMQIDQALAIDRTRTIAEQRTYLAEHNPAPPVPTDRDYHVTKKFVITLKPGKWTKAIVKQWLKEMGEP
jgi:hypothetical protein